MYKLIIKGNGNPYATIAEKMGVNVRVVDARNLPGWNEQFILIERFEDMTLDVTVTYSLNMWMNEHRYPPFVPGDLLWWGKTDDEYEEDRETVEPMRVVAITPEGTFGATLHPDDHLEMDYEDRHGDPED